MPTMPASSGGDGLADPSAADLCAANGTTVLTSTAAQADTPAPQVGQSIAPQIDPVSLRAVPIPSADIAISVPTGAVATGHAADVLNAMGGAEVRGLVSRILTPAAAASAEHAAEATRAQSTEKQLSDIQARTATQQQAQQTSADQEIQQEHARWSAHRTEIADTHTADIRSIAGQAKTEISQTAAAAKSQAAQASKPGTTESAPASEGAWDRIKKGAAAVGGAVKDAASTVVSVVGGILAAARSKIDGLINRLVDTVRQRITTAVNAIREGAARAWAAMRSVLARAQQVITQLAQAAIAAAKHLRDTVAAALAHTWQRLMAAAKSAFAAASGIVGKLGTALAKIKEILKLLDNPLLKFLIEAAGNVQEKIMGPLAAKVAPLVGKVPVEARALLGRHAAQPQSQPTLAVQREPDASGQAAGDFSTAVDHQMSDDFGYFTSNWLMVLLATLSEVLWPVKLFTEEAPGLWHECVGLVTPDAGLDRADHILGVVRRLTNMINGLLATLGVWAMLLSLVAPPLEFFTVGAYYAVSVTMIQVDIVVALAQLLKYMYSGSRAGITKNDQSRYAHMYSATAVGAVVTAVMVLLGMAASRYGARFKGLLREKPPKPVEEKPVTPHEDNPVTVPKVTTVPNWDGKPCPPDVHGHSGFHGSDLTPEQVKANGFGKGGDMDVRRHILGKSEGGDAYMGTSTLNGPHGEGGGAADWGEYVYKISGADGWDCNKLWQTNEGGAGLGRGGESPTRGEGEISVRRDVPWENIEGWYQPSERMGRKVPGEMIPNPDFGKVPSSK
jgi:hypothetical protein